MPKSKTFKRCIKKVSKAVTPRKGQSKKSAAFGICTKSVKHKK